MQIAMPDSIEALAAMLESAGTTLLAAHVPGCRPSQRASWWPEVVHAFEEAYGYDEEDMPLPQPRARAISRMDGVHLWIRLIPLDRARASECGPHSTHGGATLRRIVWLRSLVNPRTGRHLYSWRRIGGALHASHEAVRQWHGRALGVIFAALASRIPRPSAGYVRGIA